MDTNVVRSYLTVDVPAGALSLTLEDVNVFPAPPFNIRVSENSAEEEDLIVAAVVPLSNRLDLVGPTLNAHEGIAAPSITGIRDEILLNRSRVSVVDGSPDRNVNSGAVVSAPAIGELDEVRFFTTGTSIILNGDFRSSSDIAIRSIREGTASNIGPQRITRFPIGAPFSGAQVLNMQAIGGGSLPENDAQFAERIAGAIGSLSRGTVSAVRAFMLEVQDIATSKRVARLSILEEFVREPDIPANGRFRVYIDDGSGAFSPTIDAFALGNVATPVGAPIGTLDVNVTEAAFPANGFILVDPSGVNAEVLEYSATSAAIPSVFSLVGVTANVHLVGEAIIQLEEIDASTEVGRRFYKLDNIAIVEGDIRLFQMTLGVITELVQFESGVTTIADSDYLINEGTGQLEIFPTSVPAPGSQLYAFYNRYSGLIERAQRTLDGDVNNQTEFPGVRAAGVKGLVCPSERVLVNVHLRLDILEGHNRQEIRERADRVIRNYTTSLDVGEDFIIYEMTERVMGISGLYDLQVILPPANVIVNVNEVAVPGTITIV